MRRQRYLKYSFKEDTELFTQYERVETMSMEIGSTKYFIWKEVISEQK